MVRPIYLGAALLVFSACATGAPLVEVAGECADAFSGQVCTFATTQGDSLIAVGADVAIASIEQSPADHEMAWPPAPTTALGMPAASHTTAGLTEFTFFWEPMGHPPAPYLTPHFDFHFYLIPAADRLAIDCSDRTHPSTMAVGYATRDEALPPEVAAMIGVDTLFGICVPQMGMHTLPAAELASTAPFRGTMVIGYYHGKPIFIEPMISKAMLMEKKSFDLPIPEIPGVSGRYPRTFKATWNEAGQSYRFAFSGFAPGS